MLKYVNDPGFNVESIAKKNLATTFLANWVLKIVNFHQVRYDATP